VSDWFPPEGERALGRRETSCPPHVHGADYFARHLEVVEAARAGDRIFFTDWRGDSDERLADAGPTIGELLCEASRRGVHVRSLLWRSHSDKMRLNAQETAISGR
jgi:phosphatidylserine/phosphatidylglycerophosphate/cardiolipin synthase-like enzyme